MKEQETNNYLYEQEDELKNFIMQIIKTGLFLLCISGLLIFAAVICLCL